MGVADRVILHTESVFCVIDWDQDSLTLIDDVEGGHCGRRLRLIISADESA